jgi:hypothetical protein
MDFYGFLFFGICDFYLRIVHFLQISYTAFTSCKPSFGDWIVDKQQSDKFSLVSVVTQFGYMKKR